MNVAYIALTAIIAVITLAGVWKFVPRAEQESATKLWREEADAQQARADRLSDEVKDLHAQIDSLNARITAQDAAIKVMQELVTGKGKVDELTSLVQKNHSELIGMLKR